MTDRFLGYVTERIPSSDPFKSDNALIKPIASFNSETNTFIKLTKDEQIKECPPNGKIFAPLFFADFNPFNSFNFIDFSIKQGLLKENKTFNQSDFIIDYDMHPKGVTLPHLVAYEGKLSKILRDGYLSPSELNSTIDKNAIFKHTNTSFFLIDRSEKIILGKFKYIQGTDSIESVYGKEVQVFSTTQDKIISDATNQDFLLIKDNNDLERIRDIDFMSDMQLTEWFRKKYSDTSKIDKNILSTICNFPEVQSAEDDLDSARLERIKAKAEAIIIDSEEIVQMMFNHKEYFTQLSDNIIKIEAKIEKEYREKYIEQASDEIKDNIKTLEYQRQQIEENRKSLENINKDYKEKALEAEKNLKKKAASIQKEIDEKEKLLAHINDNYETIISTLKIALPVINMPPQAKQEYTSDIDSTFQKPFVFPPEGETYTEICTKTEESFKSFTQRHACIDNETMNKLPGIKNILNSKACFLPCISWAYIIAKAIRNTSVYTLHVEHDWLHYSDFCKHGLLSIFEEAHNKPNHIYFLVLENLNITQPECGLKPLLNFINGTEPVLKGYDQSFPKNLNIFATLLSTKGENALGLRLHKEYFTKWNAFGNPANIDDNICLPDNFIKDTVIENYGYIECADLLSSETGDKTAELEVYFEY